MTDIDVIGPRTAVELGIGMGIIIPESVRADFMNWTLAPHNRWSFQRVQQFARTARIPRAVKPSVLSENLLELGGIVFTNSHGEQTTVDEMLAQTWTDGILIMHRGRVVFEQYFNGMKPDTLHLMMSCSKSMTSAIAGILIEKRQLDTSKQLTSYIPELEETGLAGATVQQVLDMQVGVKFSEDYDDLDGDWRLCELATGWREPAPDYQGPREMIGYMQTLKDSDRQHGTEFHYQSILTDVLGICIERAAGASFLDLFEKHIWSRIGTEQEFVTIIDAAGNPVFEGGFNTCLRDFARFGQLICQGGVWEGEQLVPGRWIDECRFPTDRLVKVFSESEYGPALHKAAYHNKWWIRDTQRGVMMALGIHGQTLYIDPDKQFMVAKYSSQPEQTDIDLALSQVLGFETIANSL